jgi:hypothetical protein
VPQSGRPAPSLEDEGCSHRTTGLECLGRACPLRRLGPGSCHGFVATLGRLVPQMRGQEFTEDERETVRRQIGRVRAAADWLEGALDNGEFTLDEQLVQLLKGEE